MKQAKLVSGLRREERIEVVVGYIGMIIEIMKVSFMIGVIMNMRESVKGGFHCEFESMSVVAI
jgi:hypothetical protein